MRLSPRYRRQSRLLPVQKACRCCDYRGLAANRQYGYVPRGLQDESGSKTLDYVSDDHAVDVVAKASSRDADPAALMKRSLRFTTLCYKRLGFIRPKCSDGMTKMITCLWFDLGQARETAEFYASVFPYSEIGEGHASPMDNPSGKAGEELTVEFTVQGQAFIGLNGGPNFKPNMAVSLMILTENQEDTDRYWNAIVGNGGEESQCGWWKDR